MLYELYVLMVNDVIEWFVELYFEDGFVKGIFCYVYCVWVVYLGIFKNGIWLNCGKIELLNIFWSEVWWWVNIEEDSKLFE